MTENDIADRIMDAAFQLHRELGPGLLESVYEVILSRQLTEMGLAVERQVPIPVNFWGVLETKGEHLKGNDDTEYKRKMFELLTAHVDTAIRAGELDLGESAKQMSFTMLMEKSWQQEILTAGVI